MITSRPAAAREVEIVLALAFANILVVACAGVPAFVTGPARSAGVALVVVHRTAAAEVEIILLLAATHGFEVVRARVPALVAPRTPFAHVVHVAAGPPATAQIEVVLALGRTHAFVVARARVAALEAPSARGGVPVVGLRNRCHGSGGEECARGDGYGVHCDLPRERFPWGTPDPPTFPL